MNANGMPTGKCRIKPHNIVFGSGIIDDENEKTKDRVESNENTNVEYHWRNRFKLIRSITFDLNKLRIPS